jgi:ribosomal protein S17E
MSRRSRMSYINRIAYNLGIRDEEPNKALAAELAEKEDQEGIAEVAGYLKDKNKSVASDCMAVLYHIGYTKPELIEQYKESFVSLLSSKNNRMVWGAMIALSGIAKVNSEYVYGQRGLITEKIETGTVITNVWGVYTLIDLAENGWYVELKDQLFELQEKCRNMDFAKRAESMIKVIADEDMENYINLLKNRLPELSKGGQKRVNKLLKEYDR